MLQFVKCETLLSESNCDQQHLNIVAKRKTAENGIASDFDRKQRSLTAQCCFCLNYTNERALYIFSKHGLRVAQDVWIVLKGPGWNILIMKWLRPIDHKTNNKHN